MKAVAIYNLKGGVGKTTTAVNLSYLAASSGHRALLWDLDLQAASTYAFRIRADVRGFGKAGFETSRGLTAAIKQTDYDNLYLLPGDFAYRKFEGLLSSLDDPADPFTSLFAAIRRDFDVVFLDCPAGFSRLAEAILAVSDAIVVPTIPTVLSIRMVAQLVRQAARYRSRSKIGAFFSMVDRRRTLHRRIREVASAHPEIFLSADVPYASVVEQMAARRMPLHAFAPREPAAEAFAQVWAELQRRLNVQTESGDEHRPGEALDAIESMIEELESPERPAVLPSLPSAIEKACQKDHLVEIVHGFDTDQQDLKRRGDVLELHERTDGVFVVVARVRMDRAARHDLQSAEARIDRSWTFQILAGEMSPLEALERRVEWPQTRMVEHLRTSTGGRQLRRVGTRRIGNDSAETIVPRRTIASTVERAHAIR